MRFSINFVSSKLDKWDRLRDGAELPTDAELGAMALDGRDVWIIRTYIELKRRGHDVRLTDRFEADRISVAHYDDVAFNRRAARNTYLIAVRADRPRLHRCEYQVVQSVASVHSKTDWLIPHWPQPGLMARDPGRGSQVRNIGFFGQLRNLAERFRTDAFLNRLQELDMRLIVREDQWNDYRDIDVVLTVRDGSPEFLAAKPASKLINAWAADCPALVGQEPAIHSLRNTERDFIAVDTPEDVIRALTRLRSDQEYYEAMVTNGRERAREFSVDAVADHWEQFLDGPVALGYERWMRGPDWCRTGLRSFRYWFREVKTRLLHRPLVRDTEDHDRPAASS